MRVTRRIGGIAAAFIVLALALALVEPAWWLAPLIKHQILAGSGRHAEFDALRLDLDRHLVPTLRLSHLRVENAPWADTTRPLIQAGEFGISVDPASLLPGRRIVIPRVTLVDAELDLEADASGRRNWRLTKPEDHGPGRVRVQTLDAVRSSARVRNDALALDMQLRADPLAATETLPGLAAWPLTRTLTAHGTRERVAFDARFALSAIVSLYDSDQPFGLRGQLTTPAARLSVQGQGRSLLQVGGMDLAAHASGTRLDQLATVFRRHLPPLPVLESGVDAQVSKIGQDWRLTALAVRIGHSDAAGELHYHSSARVGTRPDPNGPPSQLRATLTSRHVDLAEWRRGNEARSPTPAASAPIDAEVDWQVAELAGLPWPVGTVRTHAHWRDAQLTLSPLDAVVASGRATGSLEVASTGSKAVLQLTGLHLDQLRVHALSGRLDARLDLHAQGRAMDTLLASLAGTAEAELHDATLPAALDSKLGLDAGRWLKAVITGGERAEPVRCARLQLRVDQGVAVVQQLAFETDQLQLHGRGEIDLPRRRVQLSLTPHRPRPTLLALDDSIEVSGALLKPTISLARRGGAPASAPAGCG